MMRANNYNNFIYASGAISSESISVTLRVRSRTLNWQIPLDLTPYIWTYNFLCRTICLRWKKIDGISVSCMINFSLAAKMSWNLERGLITL